jgi:hypothetical protein
MFRLTLVALISALLSFPVWGEINEKPREHELHDKPLVFVNADFSVTLTGHQNCLLQAFIDRTESDNHSTATVYLLIHLQENQTIQLSPAENPDEVLLDVVFVTCKSDKLIAQVTSSLTLLEPNTPGIDI